MSTVTVPTPMNLVPETAPFTAEQRAWLNGFFAGMLGAQQVAQAPTEVGTPQAGPVEEETPWHDPAVSMDERLKLSRADVDTLVSDPSAFVGAASAQVSAIVAEIAEIVGRHPEAGAYVPPPIL